MTEVTKLPHTTRDIVIAAAFMPEDLLDQPPDNSKIERLAEAVSRMRHYAKLQGYDPPLNAWDLCRLIAQEANCSERHAYRNMQIWFRYKLDPKTKLPPRIHNNKIWKQIEDWEEIGSFIKRANSPWDETEENAEVRQ